MTAILNGVQFLPDPRGCFANVWRQFWLSQLGKGALLLESSGNSTEMRHPQQLLGWASNCAGRFGCARRKRGQEFSF